MFNLSVFDNTFDIVLKICDNSFIVDNVEYHYEDYEELNDIIFPYLEETKGDFFRIIAHAVDYDSIEDFAEDFEKVEKRKFDFSKYSSIDFDKYFE